MADPTLIGALIANAIPPLPTVLYRFHSNGFDVELWDDDDGIAIDTADGRQFALEWSESLDPDSGAWVLRFECSGLVDRIQSLIADDVVRIVGANTRELFQFER